ncbi:MAG: hypothetical protein QXU20_04175, partial [Candidatus Woesearchaeota archaeon]
MKISNKKNNEFNNFDRDDTLNDSKHKKNLVEENNINKNLFEYNIKKSFDSVKKDVLILHREISNLKEEKIKELKRKLDYYTIKADKLSKEATEGKREIIKD